jgi:aminopeptidase N
LRGVPGAIVAAAALAMIGLGFFIHYNTHVLNPYRTALDEEQWTADYEKALLAFEKAPQPRVTAVKLQVDLYPQESRAVAAGTYTLENRTGAPLSAVHVRWPNDVRMEQLEVQGAALQREFAKFQYRIYAFAQPLQPGERRTLTFRSVREQRGFRNRGNDTRVVDNGTFLNNSELTPTLGMSRDVLLQDRNKRRKYGLPAELRPAKLEDDSARQYNGLRRDSDWVDLDITLSTVADQTPVAPGYLVSDTMANGRRTVHYRTEAPIQHFFSMQSARYAVKRDRWQNVELAVYHDPAHAWNIDRMLAGMKDSLEYCSREFSPFQFRQVRILEFPAYATFAQSFANTIPFSEGIGFIADYRDEDKIDMVTYVTAHEVAHQWWGHQVIAADMQGGSMLVETLAQYSAIMIMEHKYGPEQIRKFLKFELDRYLRARGGEVVEELPLNRVENQGYIHYRKGSLAMYLLKDQIGEAAVNRALRQLIAQYAFKGAPYPKSSDFIALLRAEAGPAHAELIEDLFEKITLVDLKATEGRTRQVAGGQWETTFTVEAKKVHADGKGQETPAPLDATIDIGLFTVEPGQKGYQKADVLLLERRELQTGKQQFTLRTAQRPKFAGIDPYNKWIDRNSDDNLTPVD